MKEPAQVIYREYLDRATGDIRTTTLISL